MRTASQSFSLGNHQPTQCQRPSTSPANNPAASGVELSSVDVENPIPSYNNVINGLAQNRSTTSAEAYPVQVLGREMPPVSQMPTASPNRKLRPSLACLLKTVAKARPS